MSIFSYYNMESESLTVLTKQKLYRKSNCPPKGQPEEYWIYGSTVMEERIMPIQQE